MINSQIRAFLRSWVLDCLGSFSKPAPGIHILNGHRIQEEPEPDTFRHLLNELSQYAELLHLPSMTGLWNAMIILLLS